MLSKEEIQNIYDYSKSKQEIIKKLNINNHQNGRNLDINILKFFSYIGITDINDISKKSLTQHWQYIQKRDYNNNPKYCECCGNILPFEKQNCKCCSKSCSIILGNKKKGNRDEITKEKISKSLIKNNSKIFYIKQYYDNNISFDDIKLNKPKLIRICKECGREFIPHLQPNGNRISEDKFCSIDCHDKNISYNNSLLRKNEILNGTFHGWKTRNIISYPEKFWINVLNNNNIPFIREYLIKYGEKFHESYFLDFYIEFNNKKIDLEIDGKQHTYPERIEKDKIRDNFISSKNIIVYRIAWNSINTEKGKKLMEEKINNFLIYLKN